MIKTIKILLFSALLLSIQSYAGNVIQTTKATAQLTSSCTISATGFFFGNLSAGVQNTTSGDFNTTCSRGIAYTIVFGWGNNKGSAAQCGLSDVCPRMARTDNSDYIPYYIFLDSTHVVGDGTIGSTYSSTGTGSLQKLTLNAKTMNNFYATPGNYIDNVLVSINY